MQIQCLGKLDAGLGVIRVPLDALQQGLGDVLTTEILLNVDEVADVVLHNCKAEGLVDAFELGLEKVASLDEVPQVASVAILEELERHLRPNPVLPGTPTPGARHQPRYRHCR